MRKFVLIILLISSFGGQAQTITATGSWTPVVSVITEAGNNYASTTIQSAPNQTLVSVSVPSIVLGLFANHYTVYVRRTDSGPNWNTAGLELWVRRTGDGAGGGSSLLGVSNIFGGDAFQQITTGDQYFFEGNNFGTTPRTSIPLQYQITGVSVEVPVANYTTTITYTLADD